MEQYIIIDFNDNSQTVIRNISDYFVNEFLEVFHKTDDYIEHSYYKMSSIREFHVRDVIGKYMKQKI